MPKGLQQANAAERPGPVEGRVAIGHLCAGPRPAWRSTELRRRPCSCRGTRAPHRRPSAGRTGSPGPCSQPRSRRPVHCSVKLDALGDDLELQRLAQGDHGGREARCLRRCAVAQEGAVHLEDVDREAAEVAQRRVAGAEVVHREPDAESLELVKPLHRELRVGHQHRLGDLERERARSSPDSASASRTSAAMSECWSCLTERLTLIESGGSAGSRRLHLARLATGLAQDPAADRHDQAHLLGERDEGVGAEHAALGVVPAQQRLDAGDAAV